MFFLFFFSALLGYFDWKPGQSCLNIKTIEGERAVSGAYWLNKTGALFQVNVLSVWHLFKELNLGAIKGIACSRLRDSQIRLIIEKAQTRKIKREETGERGGVFVSCRPASVLPDNKVAMTEQSQEVIYVLQCRFTLSLDLFRRTSWSLKIIA